MFLYLGTPIIRQFKHGQSNPTYYLCYGGAHMVLRKKPVSDKCMCRCVCMCRVCMCVCLYECLCLYICVCVLCVCKICVHM